MPFQEQRLLHFGSARLYGKDQSGNLLQYGEVKDVSIDLKTELKEAFGEGNYAFDVADSHRSIDIQAKHHYVDTFGLASSLGGTLAASNPVGYAFDEQGTVGSSAPYSYVTANTSGVVVSEVRGLISVAGVIAPVEYAIVAAGSEVAGTSCSVSGNTIKFAAADASITIKVTYSYNLAVAAGSEIDVYSTFQNSQPSLTMVCLKRDRSKVDGSTRIFAYEFQAVRDGGIKAQYQEGNHTVYERMFKAFANGAGLVLKLRAVNE